MDKVELDPETITRQLAYPPTASAKTGDMTTNKRAESRVVREGFWLLEVSESDATTIEA
jgi:hypothetical protein